MESKRLGARSAVVGLCLLLGWGLCIAGEGESASKLGARKTIADEVGLQVLDVRNSRGAEDPERLRSPFPEARRLMPHEVANELPKLSKRRWLAFVDGGNHDAGPLASDAFKRDFPLVAILDGGYPAWVSAADR